MFKVGDWLKCLKNSHDRFAYVLEDCEVIEIGPDNLYKVRSLIHPQFEWLLEDAFVRNNFKLNSGIIFSESKED